MNEKDIKNGKSVVATERKSIYQLEKRFLDNGFRKNYQKTIDLIYRCKGKLIITGIGKSGIIAQKIAASFNSTGTYSIFLHSADSIHGDLGMIKEDDIVIIISKSGDTQEVKKLIPFFKQYKIKIILITGNQDSFIAKHSDVILDCDVVEACPHNLVPTSSSTVALVIGDALAVSLLQKRGFTKEDFAVFHPGGALGKRLLLRVGEVMVKGKDIPVSDINDNLKDVIYEISSKRLGCSVVQSKGIIKGIITDGDLRRLLEKKFIIENIKAKDIMGKSPKLILPVTLASDALKLMEENKITQLIVSSDKKKVIGLIHINTLVELGLK